ncbi:MAG TPA: prenyltransferase [Acidimicrobiales bacterium]|nr:prenyltransferase [Acidimicrobiales bacterium]
MAMTGTRSRAKGRDKRRTSLLSTWAEVMRTTNPPEDQPLDFVSRWLVLTRAAVLPMTLTAGAIAALLAVRKPGFDLWLLVLAFVGITLAHVANNLMNDLYDTEIGADTADYPRALYAPHPVISGMISKRRLALASLAVNAVDLAILIVLTIYRGWPIVAFGLGGFLLSFAYTAPPLRLKKRGLGEPDVLIVWGPLMVCGTYFAAVGTVTWEVALASVPYGLLCTSVLMGKHIDKASYDAPLGIRTLPVRLGETRSRHLTKAMMIAFYVLVIVCVIVHALPWPSLIVLLALPTLVKALRGFSRPKPQAPPKRWVIWPLWFAGIAFLHTRRAGALLVLGLAIAAIANIH